MKPINPMHVLAIRINLLLVLMLLASCGEGQRQKTLKTTLVAINQARDAFVTFNKTVEITIATTAPTKEAALAAQVEYRAFADHVMAAIEAAYRLVATALTLEDDLSLQNAVASAIELKQLYDELKAKFTPKKGAP